MTSASAAESPRRAAPAAGRGRGSPGTRRPFPWLGAGLVALAAAFALPSLWYPFGRDQAAFAYVGWGWLRGFIPYVDAADNKPPAIHFLYMLGSAVFGEQQFGIRVLDLLGIFLCGWLAARAARRGGPRQEGGTGAAILLVTGFYYVCFNYWQIAQAEMWQGLAVLAGVVVLREERRPHPAALVTGLLGGVAVLFKFTAGILCLGLAVLLANRAWQQGGTVRERAVRIFEWGGLQILGGVAVVALCGAYFAACGALGDAVPLLVRFNLAYSTGWRLNLHGALHGIFAFWVRNCGVWMAMILALWGWAVVAAWRRRDRSLSEVLLVPGGLLALGALAVSTQGKFWPYHWGVQVAFLALVGAHGLAECGRRFPRLGPWVAAGAVMIGFLLGPEWQRSRAAKDPRPTTYLRLSANTWRYILGRIPRAEFLDPFEGLYRYDYADEEALGLAIRQRARAGDRLLVDGFEPAIYIVSGLRCPSRFFFTLFLDDLRIPTSREAWIEEHRQAVAADPPRFAVTDENKADRIRDLETRGFRRIEQRGRLVLFERNPEREVGPSGGL